MNTQEGLVQTVSTAGCQQAALRADDTLGEPQAAPSPSLYLVPLVGVFGALYEWHKRLVRTVASAIYLFPLLLIAKLALRFVPGEVAIFGGTVLVGDVITVAWVALLLLFFPLLAILLLLFALAGPKSRRWKGLAVEPPARRSLADAAVAQGLRLPRATPVDELARRADPGDAAADRADAPLPPLRVRGVLRRFTATDDHTLLRDRWFRLEDEGGVRIVRVLHADPMLLVPDAGPPVVIDGSGAPSILAAYATGDYALPEALVGADGKRDVPGFERLLRDGDRVEILATRYAPVADLRELVVRGLPYKEAWLDGAYRGEGGGHAIRVSSDDDARLFIRLLAAGP